MKIPKSFALVIEPTSAIFSKSFLDFLKKDEGRDYYGDFPKKFTTEEIGFTFSKGERETKDVKFKIKKWTRSGYYYGNTKTLVIFEKIEPKE